MKEKTIFIIVTLIMISSFYFVNNTLIYKSISNYSAVFFSQGITVRELVTKHDSASSTEKIKILIVAGHEPNFGGAEYKNLKERDLNLQLAKKIRDILKTDSKFEVIMARDDFGWNRDIEYYINSNLIEIENWKNKMKSEMIKLVNNNKLTLIAPQVEHAIAPSRSALFLYGINKWASENKVDITLHIHFNDNPKYHGKPNYNGFSVYVPESQYTNSTSSKILAQNILNELSKIKNVSTMPEESNGVIEDQDLIAIGRYNTSDSLSVLVEYAYIYENFMQSDGVRNVYMDKAAWSTSKAIENMLVR